MQSSKDFTHLQEAILSFFQKTPSAEKLREYVSGYNKLMAYYKCAMMEIETKLNVLNEQFSLQYDRNPINSIKTRLKSPDSIKNKLTGRNLPVTLASIEENLHDVAGVRVVCTFPQDVYTIKNALLAQDDITLLEEKDYIKNPKDFHDSQHQYATN